MKVQGSNITFSSQSWLGITLKIPHNGNAAYCSRSWDVLGVYFEVFPTPWQSYKVRKNGGIWGKLVNLSFLDLDLALQTSNSARMEGNDNISFLPSSQYHILYYCPVFAVLLVLHSVLSTELA